MQCGPTCKGAGWSGKPLGNCTGLGHGATGPAVLTITAFDIG